MTTKPDTIVVTKAMQHLHVLKSFGTLIDVHAAATHGGVSTKRIYQLIDDGRFTKFVIFGGVQLSLKEVKAWSESERSPACRKSLTTGEVVVPDTFGNTP